MPNRVHYAVDSKDEPGSDPALHSTIVEWTDDTQEVTLFLKGDGWSVTELTFYPMIDGVRVRLTRHGKPVE
jgi:hypothetical protein